MRQRNPANSVETSLESRSRVPMSMPQLKLAVPEIPGYHLHWMRGDAGRIAQAQRAGYEFVNHDEVNVTNTGLADDAGESGNTDLGTRVSVIAGRESGPDGQPGRLYLMKIRQEFWEEDQQLLEDRNESIAAALRGGKIPGTEQDGHEYVPQQNVKTVKNLFTRKK